MEFKILTIFPEVIDNFINFSILKRAIKKNIIKVTTYNIRHWTKDKHQKIDDKAYGGGPGMVMMCQPIVSCLQEIKKEDDYVILLTPQGNLLRQAKLKSLKQKKNIILICGHYEGFDARISKYVDEKISIGNFVLTGGELPAVAIVDGITRILSGTINEESILNESFNDDLLDFDVYTRPRNFEGHAVPDVLLNGNHKEIEMWKKQNQIVKSSKKNKNLVNKKL